MNVLTSHVFAILRTFYFIVAYFDSRVAVRNKSNKITFLTLLYFKTFHILVRFIFSYTKFDFSRTVYSPFLFLLDQKPKQEEASP